MSSKIRVLSFSVKWRTIFFAKKEAKNRFWITQNGVLRTVWRKLLSFQHLSISKWLHQLQNICYSFPTIKAAFFKIKIWSQLCRLTFRDVSFLTKHGRIDYHRYGLVYSNVFLKVGSFWELDLHIGALDLFFKYIQSVFETVYPFCTDGWNRELSISCGAR